MKAIDTLIEDYRQTKWLLAILVKRLGGKQYVDPEEETRTCRAKVTKLPDGSIEIENTQQ